MNKEKIIKDLGICTTGVITLEDKQPTHGVLIPNIDDKPLMVLVDGKETNVYVNMNINQITHEAYQEMINIVSDVIKEKLNG